MPGLSRRPRHLDKLLSEVPTAEQLMLFSGLDGFVAGLLVCPELIAPSEWLPRFWGEHDETALVFDSLERAQKLLGLVMAHYNATANDLRNDNYAPILYGDPENGDTLWEAWMDGFEKAFRLRPASWLEFTLADKPTSLAFTGIMSLCMINHGDSAMLEDEMAMTKDDIDGLAREAPDLIAQCIRALGAWTMARHADSAPRPTRIRSGKVGRNVPCPCGSGKKYKKCCALHEADAPASVLRRLSAA